MDDQLKSLDQISATAIELAMKYGPRAVVAILILVAGVACGRWAAGFASRTLSRLDLDPTVRILFERITRLLVVALFAIVALQNLGVELWPLIAGVGVAGAGIALAMQGVLGNLAAGLTIIFTRPFRVGEYISIAKEEGEVLEIGLFDTILGHADRSRVVIPNRRIAGEILHDFGRIRQLALVIEVSYDADIGAALYIAGEVLRANPRVLPEPAPGVAVIRLTDARVTIGVNPWVEARDYGAASGELNHALLERFREQRFLNPAPKVEIRMLPAAA